LGEDSVVNQARDKIIVYTRTIEDVEKLSSILGCDAYTSAAGEAEQKADLLTQWLCDPQQAYIVATSALG
jgi:hypothetical protein